MDMENLDVEIGFPVGKSLAGKEDIRSGELPAGRYGVCLHQGPYDAIEPAYKALTDFVNEQGLTPTGLSYEMYLNDPQATPPEELQTRILFPLAS
jgi:effector-binding domain-containing protein